MSVTASIAGATAAMLAMNIASQNQAACNALMSGYQHSGATLAQQQAYAACVPEPATAQSHAEAQVLVVAALFCVLIGVAVGIKQWREEGVVDGFFSGIAACVASLLALMVIALVVMGVRFVFS